MPHEDQFRADPDYWSVLVPELLVRNLEGSRRFYCEVLGFAEKFGRPEDGFCYIEMGYAQIMLEAIPEDPENAWITDRLEPPFGRGLNIQIEVAAVHPIYERVLKEGFEPYRPMRTAWYREGDLENGQDEFLVQDPDGYLLRFMQHIGTRPVRER